MTRDSRYRIRAGVDEPARDRRCSFCRRVGSPMSATAEFVRADEYRALEREHRTLKEEHARLHRATSEVQAKSYDKGREDARRELLRAGSRLQQGDGIAHLTLPDNGGAIQFHTVGPHGAGPLTGGLLSPDPDFLLRIWGPPSEDGSYGVHEQGGGNLTDFSMAFDLTPDGIVIHRMDTVGVRARWDRNEGATRRVTSFSRCRTGWCTASSPASCSPAWR